MDRTIQAIIFDCFGVIRPDRLVLAYEKFGGDYHADRVFVEDTIKAANRGLIPASRTVLAERLGVTVDQWIAELDRGTDNDHRLLDFIAGLRKQYRTGLLSNASQGRLAELIGRDELDRCFDAVAESGSVGITKPDAAFYQYIAERLGVPTEACVFTDDREDYCQAARDTGMQAIRYQSFDQFRVELEPLLADTVAANA